MVEEERDLFESEALEKVGLPWDGVDHCGTCHDDSDEGYDMTGYSMMDGRFANVCCDASLAIENEEQRRINTDG